MKPWIPARWAEGALTRQSGAARHRLWPICWAGLLLGLMLTASLHAQASPAAQTPPTQAAAVKAPDQTDDPQIFGGQEAQPGAWPWQAALVQASLADASWGQYCGGTLIAPEWVLTAAHCVNDYAPHEVEVVLGRHRLSSEEGERIAIAAFLIHPDFNYLSVSVTPDLDADIALIRLATPSAQQPVTLYQGPASQEERRYVAGTVTGWGLLESFIFPDGLHEVVVPLAAHDLCAQTYGSLVTENMICAGYPKGYKDACYGDSGGPLVVRQDGEAEWQQVGIVSWGYGCAEPGYYGVYTRVGSYRAWVEACLADAASPACSGLDIYEPDDQVQQATPIAVGGAPQQHNFHLSSDRDWLTFEAQWGRTYQITVQALGERSDPLVWLYDSDGVTPLAYDDDGGGGTSARLVWRAPRRASVHLELQDMTGARGNATAYNVEVAAMPYIVYLPAARH